MMVLEVATGKEVGGWLEVGRGSPQVCFMQTLLKQETVAWNCWALSVFLVSSESMVIGCKFGKRSSG